MRLLSNILLHQYTTRLHILQYIRIAVLGQSGQRRMLHLGNLVSVLKNQNYTHLLSTESQKRKQCSIFLRVKFQVFRTSSKQCESCFFPNCKIYRMSFEISFLYSYFTIIIIFHIKPFLLTSHHIWQPFHAGGTRNLFCNINPHIILSRQKRLKDLFSALKIFLAP